MGFLNKYALAIKLVAFGLVVCAALWLKADNAKLSGELTNAKYVSDFYKTTNEANVKIIEGFSRQRVDNDKIAEAVASRLEANRKRQTDIETALDKAYRDDPNATSWGAVPIPDSVRGAINNRNGVQARK